MFGSLVRLGAATAALLAVLLTACDRPRKVEARTVASSAPSVTAKKAPDPELEAFNTFNAAPSGESLVARFECGRCHLGLTPMPDDKQCTGCHYKIVGSSFAAPEAYQRWRKNIRHLTEPMILENLGARFRQEWLTEFLLEPRDVRPHLEETMPRFAMTRSDAEAIAAWLTQGTKAPEPPPGPAASLERGREVYTAKRCAQCHEFSGVMAGEPLPATANDDLRTPHRLAPDLRITRERMPRGALLRWLENPSKVSPMTPMPGIWLAPEEIQAVAAFILEAPLAPLAPQPLEPRLPLLTRPVTYDEVEREVFHRTCWHCHAEPNYARGDGGPGNTGGFGFLGVRLSLLSYETVLAGYRSPKGETTSLFQKNAEGVPRLVEALLARQDEERGHPRPGVRGMPLGLPSLRPEQIQLVETWIAQGRRR